MCNASVYVIYQSFSYLRLHILGERGDKLVEVLHKAHKADMEKLVYLVNQESKAKVELME